MDGSLASVLPDWLTETVHQSGIHITWRNGTFIHASCNLVYGHLLFFPPHSLPAGVHTLTTPSSDWTLSSAVICKPDALQVRHASMQINGVVSHRAFTTFLAKVPPSRAYQSPKLAGTGDA
eukprot:GHVU01031858.1.p1 GENE.GHVU01031858.1~~GHVU01031858.1.p1  ORF type:complete len:121 (+),score=4.42 GHVU01031858.1:204-566(+)